MLLIIKSSFIFEDRAAQPLPLNDNWQDDEWVRRNTACADYTALLHACADMTWGLKLLRSCGYLP